jgi:hypothetical protein
MVLAAQLVAVVPLVGVQEDEVVVTAACPRAVAVGVVVRRQGQRRLLLLRRARSVRSASTM